MILIYLYNTPSLEARWVILNETNQIQQTVTQGHLTSLAPFAQHTDVYVIVPAEDVVLTSVELPKLNRQRLLQALPFALEEQLIDDVSELHFVTGEYETNHSVPVAIVSQQKMNQWIHRLQEVNISPNVLIPATLALPFIPENWQVSVDHTICAVRTGKYSGFACDKENLFTFLTLKLSEEEKKPDGIHIKNISNEKLDLMLDQIPVNEIKESEKVFLENMTGWIKTYPFINLLQGKYRPKQKSTQAKKIWQKASYLFAAFIGLAFMSNSVSFFILHHEKNHIEQSINMIYHRNFPEATSVVAPKDRMEQKLKKISTQSDNNRFLNLLGFIGESLSKTSGVRLLNLEFRDKVLNLAISAAAFDNLDTFTQSLTQQGLNVKQQNAGSAGSQVTANILIRTGTQ